MENGNNNFKFGDDIEITAEQVTTAAQQSKTGATQLPDEIEVSMEGQSSDDQQPQEVQEQQVIETAINTDTTIVPEITAEQNQPNNSPADTVVEINDQQVFEYLSKTQGREIKSYDDLIVKETTANPLDSDPYTKAFFEWRQKTGRTIEEFAQFNKDWSKENDLKVAEEFLKMSYPDFTEDEIAFKMRKLVPSEYDDEDVLLEKKVALKEIASKGRSTFESMKADLGSPLAVNYPEEVQADLNLAKEVKESFAENQRNIDAYTQGIINASNNTQSIPLKINEDLTINFNLSEDKRKSLPEMIATMPEWHNEDGSWNHQKVVESGIKALYFDEILKTATEQAFNAGKESILKQGNNITISEPTPAVANQQPQNNEIIIEDDDNFFNQRGTRVKFGNRFK